MYLKSMDIHGFKSFAEKASLSFLPPKEGKQSITAIVGPNGSGKSNVADAIRWVLGEQSLKVLRGKKSEDIIFSGSDAKGKMGMAVVSLVLDNSDGRMPMDAEEVNITRRLYRSGESEYLVNSNPVRLFDLQVLLAQAQFGHGSYSVIGQGMIDRLILQTSAERKDFFDEACGIKEFQIKRHQAELKLARTREHVAEAELLLNEINPRLRTLSRQVKKLEERSEIEARLRGGQVAYYATLWQEQTAELHQVTSARESFETESRAAEEKLTKLREELRRLAHGDGSRDRLQELQRNFQLLLLKKNTIEADRAELGRTLEGEYRAAGEEEISWLTSRLDGARAALDAITLQTSDAEQSAARSKDALHEAQEVQLASQTKREEYLRRIEMRARELEERGVGTVAPIEAGAVGVILSGREKFGRVFGVVAELGTVPTEYQLALDIAAGAQMSSVVVATPEVAEAWINHLRTERLGVATFLPLSKIKPRIPPSDLSTLLREPGVRGLASDLVTCDPAFETIFSYLFGTTLVVDDVATARRIGIGRIRMVTLAGDLIETSGSMRGGYRRRGTSGFSFAHNHGEADGQKKEKELREWREAQEVLDQELQRLDRAVAESQTAVAGAESRLTVLLEQQARLSAEFITLTDDLKRKTAGPGEYNALMKDVKKKLAEHEAELRAAQEEITKSQREMDMVQQEEGDKRTRMLAAQESMQAIQQELNRLTMEKNTRSVEIARLETRLEDVAAEIWTELHERVETLVRADQAMIPLSAREKAKQEIEKLKYQLSLIGGIDPEAMQEYEETKGRAEGLTEQLDDLEKAMKDLTEMITELDALMKHKRDQAFREIRKEFIRYFTVLFGGGKADITEVYGEVGEISEQTEDVVEENVEAKNQKEKVKSLVGIDVVANPPGKKITNIQALSGGERTMTAIALVCAILHTNPSPFVVLDEVEAALDEANTVRFTQILHELSLLSQFILITHNRATMHAADTLYGVTMGNDGMSHLVSVQLGEKE